MNITISVSNTNSSIEELNLASYRNILLIGGSGSGKTTKVKEMLRSIKKSDPTSKVLVVSLNDEFRDIAEELNLGYTEPKELGLDPIKLYRIGLIGRHELQALIGDICSADFDIDYLGSFIDLVYRVFGGNMIEPTGDTVLSLRNFRMDEIKIAGLLIPKILMFKMMHGDLSNTLIAVDNADKFLSADAMEDLMRAVRKTGNAFVAVLQDPILNGEIKNIVSLADAVLLFHYGIEDLWMLRDALNLNEETIRKIITARIGEFVIITKQ